jgi:hypothetical protein
MYSSPLTGLNIQYDRRSCEDDDNWVSTLDNSVRCSNLSPTDEKCHHYDVNGNSGYDSCPKACGNCFEDAPSASEDSGESMESQPMGLYSGETGETNEFDPLGSSSRGRGDLEDLVYRFTYEINDKINDLSEKIDGVKDDTLSTITENEEIDRGVCYKTVCENKDSSDSPAPPSNCDDIACEKQMYSLCETNSCCKLIQDATPEFVMADESQDNDNHKCQNAPSDYTYLPFSRNIIDVDIETYQRDVMRAPPPSDSNQMDFSIEINEQTLSPISNIKRGGITYIGLQSDTINNFKIPLNDFFYMKHVYWALFNDTIDIKNSWTPYSFKDIETPISSTGDSKYLVVKILPHSIVKSEICSNEDSNIDEKYCDIFKDKNAKYYIYSKSRSFNLSESQEKSFNYGTFFYTNEGGEFKNLPLTNPEDPAATPYKVSNDFIGEKVTGLYFHYNIDKLIYNETDHPLSIQSRKLHIEIKYPLEGDDMETRPIDEPDIFALNNNLQSPVPFLYKIHDFDKEEYNINLADIEIKIDGGTRIFYKKSNEKCDDKTINITWWVSVIFIILAIFYIYVMYFVLSDTKFKSHETQIITWLTMLLPAIFITRFLRKKWRAFSKMLIYIFIYFLSWIIYSEGINDEHFSHFGINTFMILFLVYLINITTYTDYLNKFINPEKSDCDSSKAYPISYVAIILILPFLQEKFMIFNNHYYVRKIIFLIASVFYHIIKYINEQTDTDDSHYMEKNIYEWFGYNNNSSGMGALFKLFRDIIILI